MEGKHWGKFLDNSSNFTSPFLLSFDDVEKLSKDIAPNTFSLNKTNVKAENVMTTQMYYLIILCFTSCILIIFFF